MLMIFVMSNFKRKPYSHRGAQRGIISGNQVQLYRLSGLLSSWYLPNEIHTLWPKSLLGVVVFGARFCISAQMFLSYSGLTFESKPIKESL